MKYLFYITIVLFTTALYAQEDRRKILEGNESYLQNDFATALENYERALSVNPNSYEAEFNKADAIYKQQKFEEAAQQFQNLTAKAQSPEQRANAFHNMGNAYLNKYIGAQGQNKNQADLKTAIESYKNALRNNPKDDETRYNLAHAQRLLEQAQNQQQNKNNKDNQENKDKENKDKDSENKDKNKQENENEKKQDKEKDKEKEKDKDKQEKEQKQQQQQPKLSKEDAQRMLDAMNNQEKKTQQKLKKQKIKGKPVKIEKDW